MSSFSPHSDAGGTLHFPSPTHIHHVDPAAAFRQIRRSLSRSPSKMPAFRLVTSKSTSPSPSSPLSPPRELLPNRSSSANVLSPPGVPTPSPLATPYQPSLRKVRPSARKPSPLRNTPRGNSTQRSPRKRTLQESTSQGNQIPRSSAESSDDQENWKHRSLSPVGDPTLDAKIKSGACTMQTSTFAPPRATTRFERGSSSWGAKSSPLKRGDGIMNLDQGNVGSPSAKRRSLHGAIFSPDFDIFDHAAMFDGQNDINASDSSSDAERVASRNQSPVPSRTSSLRKTTLQQRHEKPSLVRSRPNADLSLDFSTPGQAPSKNRFRMSLDSVLPPASRESPFSSQGSLPNASAHPLLQHGAKLPTSSNPSVPQRHPLSRTISQSTSTSSMAEDSPTHIPIRQPEHRRPFIDFSKSMPIGAARPTSTDGENSQYSSGTSFATPENYKLVKPLPAAFMSTGLISKRHKDMDDTQPQFGASTSTMPDTPCKRHSLAEIPSPQAPKDDSFVKAHQARHSFGTPSTPFNPHISHATSANFGKGVNIFGSGIGNGRLHRSASFVSVEGDEHLQSLAANADSQSSNECEVPPTPTRHFGNSHHAQSTPYRDSASKGNQALGTPLGGSTAYTQRQKYCKSISIQEPRGNANEDSDGAMGDPPSVNLSFRGCYSSVPRSFTNARLSRNSKSPTPLNRAAFTAPAYLARRSQAKRSSLSPASPPTNQSFHLSPRTPKENMMPPDPSGLSISHQGEEQTQALNLSSSASNPPPATPTAPRDFTSSFHRSRASVTPSQVSAPVEVDPALNTRFDKVDMIGSGEFSQVYRVSRKQDLKKAPSYYSMASTHHASRTLVPDHVWAVKKTRQPYIGPKDRQRKLQEVTTLKALGQSDHTVDFVDSWEHKNHLYIQTEYCEEGSLDLFLRQTGCKGRLDDFRIWKILLEMSLGLKHVHNSGFIHLDLKPANILITFEGMLKIADFGVATRWPAQAGIEGEGDREYIGPEILRGEFDKPADIFALGLIMLEIAGNVVLPDNGVSWQRLRSGDMSDVPSLTWSSENSNVLRDASGNPLVQEDTIDEFYDSYSDDFCTSASQRQQHTLKAKLILSKRHRSGELAQPPTFMSDPNNDEALDNIVRWMISPTAIDRPDVNQLLTINGVQWIEARRRAGATIFEGNWGPADEVLQDDAEMIDV